MPITSQAKMVKRAARVRHNLKQVAARNSKLRFNVFRSNEHMYAQIIDDKEGRTVASASTMDKKLRKDIAKASTAEKASKVGVEIAKRAAKAGITDVYFDRGGRKFTGHIKTLADAARENGLKF